MEALGDGAMGYLMLNTEEWAESNFGTCALGDVRRTRRAVKVAKQMVEYPDGSTPDQIECWGDLKAAYRLFDCEDVTFTALAEPHWQQTRAQATGTVLLLGDTTETDYGIHREVPGLGPTGDGYGYGFLLHSSLMVEAHSEQVIGLAGQELFYRRPAPRGENSYRLKQRRRESEVWGRVIDSVGPAPAGARFIHVFDRGADNLEVFCHLEAQRCDWVIRAAQGHRKVRDAAEHSLALQAALDAQPLLGSYQLHVRAAKNRPARQATLEVRATQVTIHCPKRKTAYLKAIGFETLTQWVVEAWEPNPPKGVQRLHWILWTSLPSVSFAQAWQVIEYYERRWLIEEFHKALKTGCRLESRQYQTAARLEAVTAIISVLAIRMIQLKTIARAEPTRAAEDFVPKTWLDTLRALRPHTAIRTVRDFIRQLAGLGGFLLRKGDGEPGWITIWRGTDKLVIAVRGYLAMKKRCG
jgi:Transposase DNA-binding/Transposase DDE domain